MKKIITILIFAISISFYSQVSEIRNLADFNKIEANNGISIEFIQADKNVKVETDSKQKLKKIRTTVENGILKINAKGNFKLIKVYISNPTLQEVIANNAVSFTIKNTLKVPDLKLKLNNAVSFMADISVSELLIEANNAVSMSIFGIAKNGIFTIKNASSLKAKRLEVDKANVKVYEASTATIFAHSIDEKKDLTSTIRNAKK